jgi:hypothetical protein
MNTASSETTQAVIPTPRSWPFSSEAEIDLIRCAAAFESGSTDDQVLSDAGASSPTRRSIVADRMTLACGCPRIRWRTRTPEREPARKPVPHGRGHRSTCFGRRSCIVLSRTPDSPLQGLLQGWRWSRSHSPTIRIPRSIRGEFLGTRRGSPNPALADRPSPARPPCSILGIPAALARALAQVLAAAGASGVRRLPTRIPGRTGATRSQGNPEHWLNVLGSVSAPMERRSGPAGATGARPQERRGPPRTPVEIPRLAFTSFIRARVGGTCSAEPRGEGCRHAAPPSRPHDS